VLMHPRRDVGEVGSASQMLVRRRPSDVDGQRHDGNHEEDFESDMDQHLVTTDEGEEQECQRHSRAERGDVIENEVKMSGVQDEERIHGPRYATRWASRRRAVVSADHATIDAMASRRTLLATSWFPAPLFNTYLRIGRI